MLYQMVKNQSLRFVKHYAWRVSDVVKIEWTFRSYKKASKIPITNDVFFLRQIQKKSFCMRWSFKRFHIEFFMKGPDHLAPCFRHLGRLGDLVLSFQLYRPTEIWIFSNFERGKFLKLTHNPRVFVIYRCPHALFCDVLFKSDALKYHCAI